ncbi:hypothetical protein IWQ56_005716, partial [Coemansia nantahalensis]
LLSQHHMCAPRVPNAPAASADTHPDTVPAMSNISPAQWHLVCMQLLQFVERTTSLEMGELMGAAMPYAAHVLWRISEHLQAAESDSGNHATDDGPPHLAQRVADGFAERFHAFVAESGHSDLIWHTMAFIAPWTSAYTRVAALEAPVGRLLDALFSGSDAQLLCDLATGRPGYRHPAAAFSGGGIDDSNPASAAGDGAEAQRRRSALEAHMLGAGA